MYIAVGILLVIYMKVKDAVHTCRKPLVTGVNTCGREGTAVFTEANGPIPSLHRKKVYN